MHVSRRRTGRLLLLAVAVAAIGVSGAQAGSKPERNAEQMAIHWKHEDAVYASRQKAAQTQTTAAQLRAAHWKHEDALYRAGRSTSGSQRMRSAGGSRASTSDESFAWSDAGIGAVAGVAFALLAGGALLSLRKRGRALVSTSGGVLCAIVAAAVALAPPGAAGAGSSARFSDPVGDAGRAPDLASVTLTKLDSATLGVRVELARPTTLDRYTWVLIGIDTDRNQRTGGMHGSEAIVFVNGEQAVLSRLRGRTVPVPATLEGTELTFALPFAQIGARTFDFAVATLRQDADLAPDRGVFRFPPASRPVPAQRDLQHSEKRSRAWTLSQTAS